MNNLTNSNISAATSADRLPPHAPEAEAGALGSLFLAGDPAAAVRLLARLDLNLFYDLRHRNLCRALQRVQAAGKPLDTVTVYQWLRDHNQLEEVGGLNYWTALPERAVTVHQFDAYLTILRDKARRRLALHFARTLTDLATNEQLDAGTLLADARHHADCLLNLHEDRAWLRFHKPSELRAYEPPPNLRLVGDNHITRGEVTVIGGAPGVGKSRAATALAWSGATGQPWLGLPVHRQFKTMILQNENGLTRLKQEFGDRFSTEVDDWLRICSPPPYGMAFNRPEFVAALRNAVEEFQPEVFIFDPWNSAARDDRARDYLETFETVRSALPAGDRMPALVVVAHTRKPSPGERSSGRNLLNTLAGSYVLASVPRCVFVMQAASEEVTDSRVVWTCCKNNNGEMGQRSAWYRQATAFESCLDFDWDVFDQGEGGEKENIGQDDVEEIFEGGKRRLTRREAVQALMERTGFKRSKCYQAIGPGTPWVRHLCEQDGTLEWRQHPSIHP